MPFSGLTSWGKLVLPMQVPNGGQVRCPSCKAPMYVAGGPGTQKVRYFGHWPENGSCGYESDTHLTMKAVAWQSLKEEHPSSRIEHESRIGQKVADLKVTFPDRDPELGFGIAVECQFKNSSKDQESANKVYLDHGYSVLWLYPRDFDLQRQSVRLPTGEEAAFLTVKEERMPAADPDAVTGTDFLPHGVGRVVARAPFLKRIYRKAATKKETRDNHYIPEAVSWMFRAWDSDLGITLPAHVQTRCPGCQRVVDAVLLNRYQIRYTVHNVSPRSRTTCTESDTIGRTPWL